MTWRLKRTAQCPGCPWRKDVDPAEDIPRYSPEQHEKLARSIADPDPFEQLGVISGRDPLVIFTCHETADAHCVGWLHHQLGRGNNIALRMRVADCANVGKLRLRGEQHPTFEDTLPKKGGR